MVVLGFAELLYLQHWVEVNVLESNDTYLGRCRRIVHGASKPEREAG